MLGFYQLMPKTYQNLQNYSAITGVAERNSAIKCSAIIAKLALLASLFLFILPVIVNGSLIDDINKQIKETEEQMTKLEKQAQEYQNVINEKRKEIKSLQNEIATYNAKIRKLEAEINWTELKISQIKLEIIQLNYNLKKTEKDISGQKNKLVEILQAINEYDKVSDLEIILQSESLSEFFNQKTYIENLQKAAQQELENLKYFKNKLISDKQTKEEKRQELENLKKDLENKQNSLTSQRSSKKALLKYTKGQEERYREMLSHIKKQKEKLLGDISRLRKLKSKELAKLKKLQEKPPKEYWASLNWYYRQDDPRWAKTTIGLTDSTLEDYGCAVSCVAMILKKRGINITPKELAKKPLYYYDLINWPKNYYGVKLIKNTFHRGVDWQRIDNEIKKGYPVIVFIRADGKGAGHYVVIHHKTKEGRYVVHDPLFGSNIYLDSTRVYISNLYKTTTSIDQMVIYH